MGEWSKSIGEKGEKITKFLFEEILGINSLVENESIPCSHSIKHKRDSAQKGRTTHGLDGLFYVESPLEDELLDIIVISSKYTIEYPKKPKPLFKKHFFDLAHTLECFRTSKINSDINQRFNNVTKTSLTGILVWLSNSDDLKFDIKPHISSSLIDKDLEFEKIIVLDNSRIWFLYEAIFKSKEQFQNLQYVYHNSSLNQGNLNSSSYGNKFPVNYLYSDIITLRVQENGKVLFLIYLNDNFNKNNFSQALSLAKTYDHLNATNHTYIRYLDYDDLIHNKIVKSVLVDYENFKLDSNLSISNFPSDFRR
jgi:hypothetical protein